jgi:hypothetical protein
MRRTLIFCIVAFSFLFQYSQAQNYKIELKQLKSNLTFDSLKAKESEILVTVFYKNFGKSDCDKSRIIEYSNKECNINSFKDKMILLLNKSSFIIPLRVQIIYWDNASNKMYFIEDEYNKKSFHNKNYLEIEDQMAFIDFQNINDFIKIEPFTKDLNRIAKTHLLQDNFKINSIFEFTKTLKKKGVIPFPCPNEIRALYKDSLTMYSSNTCPSASIPLDDMFLEHLTLIFRPNLTINIATRIIKQNQKDNFTKIDSLKQLIEKQKNEIKKLESQNKAKNNIFSFSVDYGLLKQGFSSSDLSSDMNINRYSNFGLTYARYIKSNIGFTVNLSNFNLQGTLNSDELNFENQEVFPNTSIIFNKRIIISNLIESWVIQNAIGLNLGLIYNKSIAKKINIQTCVQIGKVLKSVVKTELKDGLFNYRATIPGISDEIIDVSSLNLKENVTYSEKFNQKFGFSGYNIGISVDADYSIFDNLYVKGGLKFDYFHLKNNDFITDNIVSVALGDFNSSFNSVKSMTILPFSIGLGIGIKF